MKDNTITHILIIIILGFILFLNAGYGELQHSDEGLYAYRAYTISNSGNYIDQTDEALSGLYSSTAPPLTVVFIHFFMSLFGKSLLAIRLFSIICSFASLVLLYLISKKYFSSYLSIFPSIILAGCVLWNDYSRQAMTDVPLITFFLLVLYLTIKYFEAKSKKSILLYAGLISFTLVMALWTKIVISLFPLLFIFLFNFSYQKINKKILLNIFGILGILIGSSWYIYMSIIHGAEFYNALFLPHIAGAVENNTRSLGLFYYINNMSVSLPIMLLSVISFIYYLIKKKPKIKLTFKLSRNRLIAFSMLSWFVIVFLMMTVSITKMPHYTNYMLVPAAFLTVYAISKFRKINFGNYTFLVLLLVAVIGLYWAFSFDFRQEAKLLAKGTFSINTFILLEIIIALSVMFLIIIRFFKKSFQIKSFNYLVLFVLSMSICRVLFLNMFFPTGMAFGAKEIVKEMSGLHAKEIVYLYHRYTTADTLNSQLEWYLLEKNSFKKPDLKLKFVWVPKEGFDLNQMNKLDSLPDNYVLYYVPGPLESAYAVAEEVLKTRKLLAAKSNYFLFSKKLQNKDKGIQI